MIRKHSAGKKRVLEIDNVHVPDCGEPPEVNAPNAYISYFENPYGEQMVFVGDRDEVTALLYGGDLGWMNPKRLTKDHPAPDCILNQTEIQWLLACWMALTGDNYDTVVKRYNEEVKRIAEKAVEEIRREGRLPPNGRPS